MGETCIEFPLRGFLSHLVFKALHILPDSPKLLPNMPCEEMSVHSSPFFHGFLPHTVSYAKFILMVVGSVMRSVAFVLSFQEDQTPTIHKKCHKYLKIWFIL